jgi:site-specific DNA-methyltransferase (adenine-specific)
MGKNSNTYKTFNVHEKTPEGFYKQLNREFGFDFDPCPLNDSPDFDGLKISWGKRVFVNPPYGKAIRGWLEKALTEIKQWNSEVIVFLLPAYTDVKWFHEIVLPKADEIRFIKGRLKFGEHNNSAPFASMIVVFKYREEND